MIKQIFYDAYGYNSAIFFYINKLFSNIFIQKILKVITDLFAIENFAVYFAIAIILHFVKFSISKINKDAFYCDFSFLMRIGIIYIALGTCYAILKFGFQMPRPFCREAHDAYFTILDIAHHNCNTSFPSSHTAISILCCYSVWRFLSIFQKILGVVIVILTVISRVALAMHYPADVMYSIPIAFCIIKTGNLIFLQLENNFIKSLANCYFNLVASKEKR